MSRHSLLMRTVTVLAAFFLSGLLGSRPAIGQTNAETSIPGFEITPFVAYRVGGSLDDSASGETAHLHDDFGFAASLSYRFDDGQALGLFYSRQSTTTHATSTSGKVGFDVEYIHLDETVAAKEPFFFMTPYMTGALGVTILSANTAGSNSDTGLSIAAGGGLRIPVQPRIDVRLEARVYMTFFDGHSSVFCPPAVTGACALHLSSSTFMQYDFLLGAAFAF